VTLLLHYRKHNIFDDVSQAQTKKITISGVSYFLILIHMIKKFFFPNKAAIPFPYDFLKCAR